MMGSAPDNEMSSVIPAPCADLQPVLKDASLHLRRPCLHPHQSPPTLKLNAPPARLPAIGIHPSTFPNGGSCWPCPAVGLHWPHATSPVRVLSRWGQADLMGLRRNDTAMTQLQINTRRYTAADQHTSLHSCRSTSVAMAAPRVLAVPQLSTGRPWACHCRA